jgi:ribonuclease HI
MNLRNELEIAFLVWDSRVRRWERDDYPGVKMFQKIHKVFDDVFTPFQIDAHVLKYMMWAGVNVPFPIDFSEHMHAVITSCCDASSRLGIPARQVRILHSVRRIQRMWRRAISTPSYKVCRRRLSREFQEMAVTRVFTDGACSDNGRKGAKAAWAAVFPDYPEFTCSGRLEGEQTNNRAEFTAAIKALEISNGALHIFTDSQLLVNIVTGRWKAKVNLDLVERLGQLTKDREVTWTHVRAHTGKNDEVSLWNAEADRRATDCLKNNIHLL